MNTKTEQKTFLIHNALTGESYGTYMARRHNLKRVIITSGILVAATINLILVLRGIGTFL